VQAFLPFLMRWKRTPLPPHECWKNTMRQERSELTQFIARSVNVTRHNRGVWLRRAIDHEMPSIVSVGHAVHHANYCCPAFCLVLIVRRMFDITFTACAMRAPIRSEPPPIVAALSATTARHRTANRRPAAVPGDGCEIHAACSDDQRLPRPFAATPP